MAACEVYLRVMTWSLSALAVYDAGAALCRSIGKTWVTMYISAAANIVNIIGHSAWGQGISTAPIFTSKRLIN